MFGDNTTCPITKNKVVESTNGKPLAPSVASLIKIDPISNVVTVVNSANETKTINFYIKVETETFGIGYK
jgi:hypothetical protein